MGCLCPQSEESLVDQTARSIPTAPAPLGEDGLAHFLIVRPPPTPMHSLHNIAPPPHRTGLGSGLRANVTQRLSSH